MDRKKIIITILLLITAAAIGVTVWAIWFRDTAPELAPEYAPPEIEENAESMDDEQDKMDAAEGGGAVSMTYQKEVTISLADNTASMMFQNPSKSVNDMVLQLLVVSGEEETVIAQSGNLPPGYKLEKLDMLDGAAKLSPGTYTGKFNILYYDPDTGEKAIVNGSIDGITITVTD